MSKKEKAVKKIKNNPIKNIGKINTKAFDEFIKKTDLNDLNVNMLSILVKIINQYMTEIEERGLLITEITREGCERIRRNPAADALPSYMTQIMKILKDNKLNLNPEVDMLDDEFDEIRKKLLTD